MGERRRYEPESIRGFKDDLAVEISLEMRRRGMTITELGRVLGACRTRRDAISRYLRGLEHDLGLGSICQLAEHLEIPVRILTGDEAKEPAPAPEPTPVLSVARPPRRFVPLAGQLALPFIEACAA